MVASHTRMDTDSPRATTSNPNDMTASGFKTDSGSGSAVLHRTLRSAPMQIVSAKGTSIAFSDDHVIEDTTCGAAVACLGHGNERVKQAMIDQIDKFSYCNSMFFGHQVGEELASELVRGTNGAMSKAYIMCSGEAFPIPPPQRCNCKLVPPLLADRRLIHGVAQAPRRWKRR